MTSKQRFIGEFGNLAMSASTLFAWYQTGDSTFAIIALAGTLFFAVPLTFISGMIWFLEAQVARLERELSR